MSKVLVKVQNLGKSYPMGHGQVEALQSINLIIHAGDSLAIMGPSGSGKSTLLHLIGCLDKPSTGHYWLDGEDVSTLDDQALALIRASKIGFVFQSFNLISQLNVYDNIAIPFLYQSKYHDPVQMKKRILESIDRVGLSHRLYHVPSELSGGETQRAAIARALAIDPLLILADEPTGNLDTDTGNTILKLFDELNRQGVTILTVTHDEHVGAHCRRLIRMCDGKIVSEATKPLLI
ncbi:MAG: ABC transporter ATP-binding protein [Candidatus Protochlamydia sp.]|nr:ABC transporter ATP-binding protein [Candidatus Protochlamydia sp.]